MRRQGRAAGRGAGLAVALIALAFALWLHGGRVIHPASHAWLLHGDPAQHFLGSVFFLSEPWHWPPGMITRFGEAPTSVVFTDSIPLLALVAKALGWPAGWQYFGLWMVACHVLAGWFALRLLRRMAMLPGGDAGHAGHAGHVVDADHAPGHPGPALQAHREGGFTTSLAFTAAALFFVFAPTLLLRVYGHEALMAQFLVLAALERALAPWRFGPWLLLVAVSVLVHPYLAVMCAVIGLGAAIAAVCHRQVAWPALVGQGVIAALLLYALAWMAGYFVGAGQVSAAGHGFFSANALTWIDPMDWAAFNRAHQRAVPYDGEWSRWLPAQAQATGGQYEGFAYLGAGMLLVLGVALVLCLCRGLAARRFAIASTGAHDLASPGASHHASDHAGHRASRRALWITAILLALWAWSLRPSVGAHVLVDIPAAGALESFLGTFRASGRFIWPLTYLAMAWAFTQVLRAPAQAGARGRRWAVALIVLALVLQWVDLRGKLREFRTRMRIGPAGIEQPVDLVAWRPVLTRCPLLHIVSEALPPEGWIGPTLAAALSGAQVDPAPTARRSQQTEQAYRDAARQLITTQGWRADTVYLLAQPLSGASLDAILPGLPSTHVAQRLQDRTLVVPQACLPP